MSVIEDFFIEANYINCLDCYYCGLQSFIDGTLDSFTGCSSNDKTTITCEKADACGVIYKYLF